MSVAGGAARGRDEVTLRGYGLGRRRSRPAHAPAGSGTGVQQHASLNQTDVGPIGAAMPAPAPARPGLPSGPGVGRPSRTVPSDGPPDGIVDRGGSLIEALVSVVVLGLVATQLIAAVQVATTSSGRLADEVTAEAVAADIAVRLVADDADACPHGANDAIAEATAIAGWPPESASITPVGRAAPSPDGVWRWTAPPDADGVPPSDGMSPLLCRVTVQAPDGRASAMRSVVLAPGGPT